MLANVQAQQNVAIICWQPTHVNAVPFLRTRKEPIAPKQIGMALSNRQVQTGHGDVRMTMHYTHSDLERRRAGVEAMSEWLTALITRTQNQSAVALVVTHNDTNIGQA